jgi:uncharacterized protein YbaA (DUF1428 family)
MRALWTVKAIVPAFFSQKERNMKGGYIDGFVFPVPKKKFAAYKKMAAEGAAAWKKFGALEYFECKGDDLKPKAMGAGKQRSFTAAANAKAGEEVWFSFIVFKNRAHRDAVNKKVMAYFAKKYADQKDWVMPFDPKKMVYGGFKAVINK